MKRNVLSTSEPVKIRIEILRNYQCLNVKSICFVTQKRYCDDFHHICGKTILSIGVNIYGFFLFIILIFVLQITKSKSIVMMLFCWKSSIRSPSKCDISVSVRKIRHICHTWTFFMIVLRIMSQMLRPQWLLERQLCRRQTSMWRTYSCWLQLCYCWPV